ncbi:hypothetical protein KGM_208593 [Danaus plexippus plexippus]|uniref:DUF4758 domain-containing protein n=1 Tax=Danaus plexippus plexippus TaxID=278856 RepID=A0A212FFN2_DANPL|nr:hypothetical protein KGM_208593 [Danaus plexippus plexippus]
MHFSISGSCALNFLRACNLAIMTSLQIPPRFTQPDIFIHISQLKEKINDNESIDVSRVKREGVPENRDLTVLLVNDQKRNDYNKNGRYHSVKPLIGLLTSTARTFIQDGVTTEYATQILGTTLDNGRIYAQLLTKSSLVLYNKPSNDDDAVIVQPTRAHSVFDGEWNVKQDLGIIDPDKFVLKNTDYLAPSSKMEIVYASRPAQENFKSWNPPVSSDSQVENQIFDEPTARKVQSYDGEPKFEVYNYLDGPTIENDKKLEYMPVMNNVNYLYRQSKAYEPVNEPSVPDTNKQEDKISESNIVKVKPSYDLPTFTIKNEFSPIFYYIDNVESRRQPQESLPQTKQPKKLFGQKSESRPKKTFTYAGFADFTTVVGDTVIIFTPNTETVQTPRPGEVNVFPSAKPVDKLATKITFLSADIPLATSTFKPHEVDSITKVPYYSNEESITEKVSSAEEQNLKKAMYEVDDKVPDTVSVQYNNNFELNVDVIQPSEPGYTTTESTRVTDDLEIKQVNDLNFKATDPLTFLSPTNTVVEEPKETVVTEEKLSEILTNSEEESENTAAEVTEKPDEEEEEEDDDTKETEPDILTTTESGHSDESYEIETTTENKYDKHEEVYCSDGLETQSTMTTAYKTLTYLTTYFIPLESTDTTTSIKSDVVVESDVGYITNYICKTNLNIDPTSVMTSELDTTQITNIESPEVVNEDEISISANKDTDIQTERTSETIPNDYKEVPTVSQDDEKPSVENTKETTPYENVQQEDSSQTTTTERVSTSQSHIEVSVSTESTPTDNQNADEDYILDSVNEIDLIYKTLYTTYTYFTTFFGDQTSSVASHKSIITNIITSTIDLSKLDPSLLGAFDDGEISPTNVEGGKPTETLAINSIIDLVKNKDVIESVEGDKSYSSQTPTPNLDEGLMSSIKPDSVKTYYTTYTFFTTIYVGSDANICSRNEVYTNYVGPDELIPTKTNSLIPENTRAQFDFRNCKQVKGMSPQSVDDNSSVETSITSDNDQQDKENAQQPSPIEVDMLFSVESNPLVSDNAYVTDVKSSSSKGETKYLDNNNVLDDQISSESNIDEIIPSPTLLLQTSYTTFTYFTTMYIGTDSSKIKSRLETITNVVTETITPKTEPEEENNLPITYYTTFTYWTTLYKDKSTTITSREEIVSNVVTPSAQSIATVSPIDTTPIDIVSVLPPNIEPDTKPSLQDDVSGHDDGKTTVFTTYTYFTTFYAGNTSQIRSSLETVTNIVDNTQLVEDNQLGRKVPNGAVDKNLIKDLSEKPYIPTKVKEEIQATKLQGTYIDNLFAEVKPIETNTEKKILFSQVAVISGDSTIITSDNKTLDEEATTTQSTTSTTTTEKSIISPTPEVIESSVAEPEVTTESMFENEEQEEENPSVKKKGRLTFTTKKPSFTPVIIPFASRNRPTFSPKRLQPNSATTITRADFTPTITATPTLKSVRPSGSFAGNRKQQNLSGSSSSGKRFYGRSSASINLSANVSPSRAGGSQRGSITPSSRRTGFRSSSSRGGSISFASRSAIPRIRPTASSRLRGSRQSASIQYPPIDQNESETFATQQEESVTESLDEATEFPARLTTNNPLLKFRRPPIVRQPGTAIAPRTTTPSPRRAITTRARTTTTKRSTTRSTTNPLLSLRRQRPNGLFPRRNLFRQPEPEPEEEIEENEQKVEDDEELLDEEEFEEDNDYDASNRKEQQVASPFPVSPRRNTVQIRPFAFKRRVKRQVDYGNRKYSNFRRPGTKSVSTRRPEPEPETEPPAPSVQKQKTGRYNSRISGNGKTTTAASPKHSSRQPFIIRGESRSTTTNSPAYRRGKTRTSGRTTTLSSRIKSPRPSGKSTQSSRSSSSRASTGRSRSRTTTSKASSRQRNSFENLSGERRNKYDNILNDGKITITHQIPFEVTIPIVNGKITEYKNVLSAKPSVETLLLNQVSTSIGPIGNHQLVLAMESTELADNGATKITKFILHETPTSTIIFTPTTIRGRKTSYSHLVPSTVYNVEPVVQTIAPEINANVPLANLLLSQLLLGNQQPAINPLLALQGQALLPQQQVVQTPVTEYKTRSTTYVTTVTDNRETVLSITFRGVPVLTTINNPTTDIITATEFITDTVVTTPTVLAPPPQYNSLLLPLLLQQQQQQQQQALSLQTANPLLGNSPKPNILPDFNSNEDFSEDIQNSGEEREIDEYVPPPTSPPPPRKRSKPRSPKPKPVAPPKQTSVVTLYVSGRHPGEFSTVLSTVVTDETQTVRKREAIYYDDVKILPSLLPTIDQLVGSQDDNLLENSIMADKNLSDPQSHSQSQTATQSLESIIGKINYQVNASPTYVVKLDLPSTIRDMKHRSLDEIS